MRSILTLGNFSISSNITAQSNTSTLRFIAEDLNFFISNKVCKNVDIKKDYICVIDLGLFELSLRMSDKMYGGSPRVDLRASNNILHVRTCSDSCRALMQLLTYFASDGDLTMNKSSTDSLNLPNSGDDETLLGNESMNYLSKSQVARVNSLMEEAMEDTEKGSLYESENDFLNNDKVEVFFFPDERTILTEKVKKSNEVRVTIPQMDLDDVDDDFCILGEEAGVGIAPKNGIPEVRMLCQEPLRVIDNHFAVPLGKTDFLKAPKHFPPPVLRYTLCEMTLVWHLYGGKDFGDPQNVVKKHVTLDERNLHHNNMQER